jgi:hypothetical protein
MAQGYYWFKRASTAGAAAYRPERNEQAQAEVVAGVEEAVRGK